MGSLPNLTEICKKQDSPVLNWRGLPAEPQEQNQRVATQSFRNERCKIRYRQSERGYLSRPKRKMLPSGKWVPFDKFILQQTATSSPSSARSANLTHVVKRRDSLTSSIGATSIRRLISVVPSSNNRTGPLYGQKIFIHYLVVFCVSHLLANSTIVPFLVLQGSVSIWTLPFHYSLPFSIDIGSSLLALMYMFAAYSTLFGSYIIHRFGINATFLSSYAVLALFFATHLYPNLYLLVPAYVLSGIAFGQLSMCSVEFMMGLSVKMACTDDDEDLKAARRTVIIRRLARSIQASQDLGLIFGSFIAAMTIAFWRPPLDNPVETLCNSSNCSSCAQTEPCTACPFSDVSYGALAGNCTAFDTIQSNSAVERNALIDKFFDTDEHGHRLCGAFSCASAFVINTNNGTAEHNLTDAIVPRATSVLLSGVFVGFSLVALIVSGFGLRKLKLCATYDSVEGSQLLTSLRSVKDSFKDVKLQLVAPLSFFIGLEQAFVYSDFSKSYVVCTLGVQHLNLVFLSMGVLQSVAACTLSMLLKSIQRYYVVCVGFIFQCCVLMVQILWKPMSDDPALFYVIPAVWGVCNAIWEILIFSLLTKLYMDKWSAPFCNTTFFRFLGLSLSFAFHGHLCNWIKLYVLAVVMIFAVFVFFYLEIRLSKPKKNIGASPI